MKTIEFRKEDRSKADQFLLNHWDSVIVPFGLEHADKLGHVEVFVKEDWTLKSMRFIKGPFERKQFRKIKRSNDTPVTQEITEAVNVYYEVLYCATETKIMVYDTYLHAAVD
jgi:hypothetical protein